jgi:orotate phosphoribosyltransferase-like protein
MYRIKEIETNVIYDDVYTSIEEARQTINEYVADDGDERAIAILEKMKAANEME